MRARRMTLQEIADIYKISKQRVQQIENHAPVSPKNRKRKFPIIVSKIDGRNKTRELVRIRDNFTCQDCGKRRTRLEVEIHNKNVIGLKGRMKSFDIHHTNGECGKKSLLYDHLENMDTLITLCHKCHYNRPEHKTKSKEWSEIASKSSHNRKKAYCPKGHPYSIENTRINKKGRQCRICRREQKRKYWLKRNPPKAN